MTNIARVFPRKTAMTPDDDMVFFDGPPIGGRVAVSGLLWAIQQK